MATDERRRTDGPARSERRRADGPVRRKRHDEPDRNEQHHNEPDPNDQPRDDERTHDGLSAMNAAQRAAKAVQQLTGRDLETVISIEHVDGGWQVGVEVVEAHRIPDSADILATYQTDLDGAGRLKGYRRTARYPRGKTRED